MVPLEILRSLLSKNIKFAQIGARSEKLWLLEKRGCPSYFSTFFRCRFRPNRRCYWRTESCTSQPELPSFLKFQTCRLTRSELRRLCAQRWSPGRKNVSDFQHAFLTFIDFPVYGWLSSRCWFSMILVSLESLRCLLRSVTNLARSRVWACEIWSRKQRLLECFYLTKSHFPTEISAWLGKLLAIRELYVVAELVLSLKILNLQVNL